MVTIYDADWLSQYALLIRKITVRL